MTYMLDSFLDEDDSVGHCPQINDNTMSHYSAYCINNLALISIPMLFFFFTMLIVNAIYKHTHCMREIEWHLYKLNWIKHPRHLLKRPRCRKLG